MLGLRSVWNDDNVAISHYRDKDQTEVDCIVECATGREFICIRSKLLGGISRTPKPGISRVYPNEQPHFLTAFPPASCYLPEKDSAMTKQIVELEVKPGLSIYVEAEADTSGGSYRELSGGTQEKVKKAFSDVSEVLSAVAANVQEKFGALKEAGPNKVVVELHAQVKAGGTLFLINGEGQGGIKVQLTWERQ